MYWISNSAGTVSFCMFAQPSITGAQESLQYLGGTAI